MLERFFLPKWWILIWSFGEDGWYSTIAPKNIMWSFEWFSKSSFVQCFPVCQEGPDCSNAAHVPSFTRRTALSAMSFVSDRWGEVRWFHDKTSHAFPNSTELSVYTTFAACDGSKNFNRFLPLTCRFCFTRIILNTMSGKILYHHSVSVIVSGFASHIKDFVICRYQVTKLFCCGKASPVRLLQEAFVILVLKQTSQFRMWVKILCFLDFFATS